VLCAGILGSSFVWGWSFSSSDHGNTFFLDGAGGGFEGAFRLRENLFVFEDRGIHELLTIGIRATFELVSLSTDPLSLRLGLLDASVDGKKMWNELSFVERASGGSLERK